MGRKTFESMPKALPNRTNIVLTKNKNYKAEGAFIVSSVEEALDLAGEDDTTLYYRRSANLFALYGILRSY